MFVVEGIQQPEDTAYEPPEDGSAFWFHTSMGTALFTVSSDWLEVMRDPNRYLALAVLVMGGMTDGTLGDRDLFYATEDQEEFLKSLTKDSPSFVHASILSKTRGSKRRKPRGFA
jgi:hypothetical protein